MAFSLCVCLHTHTYACRVTQYAGKQELRVSKVGMCYTRSPKHISWRERCHVIHSGILFFKLFGLRYKRQSVNEDVPLMKPVTYIVLSQFPNYCNPFFRTNCKNKKIFSFLFHFV